MIGSARRRYPPTAISATFGPPARGRVGLFEHRPQHRALRAVPAVGRVVVVGGLGRPPSLVLRRAGRIILPALAMELGVTPPWPRQWRVSDGGVTPVSALPGQVARAGRAEPPPPWLLIWPTGSGCYRCASARQGHIALQRAPAPRRWARPLAMITLPGAAISRRASPSKARNCAETPK